MTPDASIAYWVTTIVPFQVWTIYIIFTFAEFFRKKNTEC